jgi:hypothetical protein
VSLRRMGWMGAGIVAASLAAASVAPAAGVSGAQDVPTSKQPASKAGAAKAGAEAKQKPAAAPAAPNAASADVQVRTLLDRTAVWVADPVTYTVTLTCAPGIDVLDDDLSRDKVKLDGLEITGTESARDAGPNNTTIRTFTYHLTSYHVDQRALTIAPMTARYYKKRPGQGIENAAPAGEVQIPGAVVAFRSMLPEDQENYPLRDSRASGSRPRLMAAAQPIGTGLVLVAIVPAMFWMVGLVRERRPKQERRSIRQVQQEERTSLEAVRAIDVTTPDGRRDAYTKINMLVRDHLRDVCGVPGPSLTAAEVEPALAGRATRVPAEAVAALLAACETARYAPAAVLPEADACRDAIEQAAQVLTAR